MAGKKRIPVEVEHNRQQIAWLYLQGHSQLDIVTHLGLSQQAISYNLLSLRDR